ncbi:hypothetical protein LXL04_033096 [Taraxacum kok-saghyz]
MPIDRRTLYVQKVSEKDPRTGEFLWQEVHIALQQRRNNWFITRFKRYHSTGDCLPKRFPISPSRPLNFLYQTQWAKSDPRTSVIQVSPVSLRIFNEWGISTATPRDPS